jgi:hypothetical protein
MPFDTYSMEQVVKLRLAEARTHAARMAMVAQAAEPARSVRFRVGLALIRVGRRLARQPHPQPRLA